MKLQDYFDTTGWVTPEEPDMVQSWLDKYPAFRAAVLAAYGDGNHGKLCMVYNSEMDLGCREAETMFQLLHWQGTQFSSSEPGAYICGNYGNGWLIAGEGDPLASAVSELFVCKELIE